MDYFGLLRQLARGQQVLYRLWCCSSLARPKKPLLQETNAADLLRLLQVEVDLPPEKACAILAVEAARGLFVRGLVVTQHHDTLSVDRYGCGLFVSWHANGSRFQNMEYVRHHFVVYNLTHPLHLDYL